MSGSIDWCAVISLGIAAAIAAAVLIGAWLRGVGFLR
jgi:hypothetical protein